MPSIRLLHVEDDALDRLLLKRWIERACPGVSIVAAASSADVRDALATHRFAFVLTDNRLPELDAEAVVRLVRAVRADVPVVVMSGGMTDEQQAGAIAAGAAACLTKDDRDGLLRILREFGIATGTEADAAS